MNQNHTLACQKSQAAYQQRLAEFEAKHPNYCRKCGGLGIFYWQGFDYPCQFCAGASLCPLCGKGIKDDECACGWAFPESDQAIKDAEISPEEPPCICPEQGISTENWALFYTEEMELYRP